MPSHHVAVEDIPYPRFLQGILQGLPAKLRKGLRLRPAADVPDDGDSVAPEVRDEFLYLKVGVAYGEDRALVHRAVQGLVEGPDL